MADMSWLDDLRAALRPAQKLEQYVFDRHSDKLMSILADQLIDIESIGGNCPLQIEGRFDGFEFYFRARYDFIQFHVYPKGLKLFSDDVFIHEQQFGEGYEAGWMWRTYGLALVGYCVSFFRNTKYTPKP